MECNIVLGHELEQLHIVRVEPPLPPLVRVVGRDRDVPVSGVSAVYCPAYRQLCYSHFHVQISIIS
jgi:hypothetical protein